MSVSEVTARQLLREYFEDYDYNSKFIYVFGGEQLLVTECLSSSGGVSKSAIISLFNDFLDSHQVTSKYIVDMRSCTFLVVLQIATFVKLSDGQNHLSPSINYCKFMHRFCKHVDISYNSDIGFVVCSGVYCDVVKKFDSTSERIFDSGFGEDLLL